MLVTAWRIFKPRHAATAFTGEGARLFGGRWNNKGVAVVYTSQSLALAALEMLVHLHADLVLARYQVAAVTFDSEIVLPLDPGQLPRNWRADPPPARLRRIGDQWVAGGASAVLRVPSAVIDTEFNFLLNPAHPDFAKLIIGKPQNFKFDRRLAN
jgi:RES domain-containing protein